MNKVYLIECYESYESDYDLDDDFIIGAASSKEKAINMLNEWIGLSAGQECRYLEINETGHESGFKNYIAKTEDDTIFLTIDIKEMTIDSL